MRYGAMAVVALILISAMPGHAKATEAFISVPEFQTVNLSLPAPVPTDGQSPLLAQREAQNFQSRYWAGAETLAPSSNAGVLGHAVGVVTRRGFAGEVVISPQMFDRVGHLLQRFL